MTVEELKNTLGIYPLSCEVIRSLNGDNGISTVIPVTMSEDGSETTKILLLSGNEPVLDGNHIISVKESERKCQKKLVSTLNCAIDELYDR